MDFQAKLLEFLKKSWPFLAVLVIGIGIGWYVKPDVVRVEEKLKTVEVEKQVVVTQEKVRVEVVKIKDSSVAEKYHREKTEEKRPDGTVLTKETEDRNVDTVVKEKENQIEVKVVEVEKQVVVTQEVIKEKLVEPVLAQWHLGVLAGVQPQFNPLAVGPFTFGIEAEHRFIGPIFLGIWGTTNTTFQNMQVGAKVGFEF